MDVDEYVKHISGGAGVSQVSGTGDAITQGQLRAPEQWKNLLVTLQKLDRRSLGDKLCTWKEAAGLEPASLEIGGQYVFLDFPIEDAVLPQSRALIRFSSSAELKAPVTALWAAPRENGTGVFEWRITGIKPGEEVQLNPSRFGQFIVKALYEGNGEFPKDL